MTAKPSLVLVPGLSGRPQFDFPFLAPMLRRRFEVTEVSFDSISQPTLATLRHIVTAAVLACAAPPLLVGYSLGAVVAAGIDAPLAGRVLIAGWLTPAPKLAAFAENWALLRAEGSVALDSVAAHALYSPDGWDAARSFPADAVTDGLMALAAITGAAEFGTDAPTLVIGCSRDEVATTREAQLLFGAIRDARYAEVRSGHAVTHERPAELLELIISFAAAPAQFPAGSIITEQAP